MQTTANFRITFYNNEDAEFAYDILVDHYSANEDEINEMIKFHIIERSRPLCLEFEADDEQLSNLMIWTFHLNGSWILDKIEVKH